MATKRKSIRKTTGRRPAKKNPGKWIPFLAYEPRAYAAAVKKELERRKISATLKPGKGRNAGKAAVFVRSGSAAAANAASSSILAAARSNPAKRKASPKRGAKNNAPGYIARALAAAKRKVAGRRRGNPGVAEDEASELYEEFHGHPPKVVIDVATPVYEHSTLSGLGVLKALVIKAVNGTHEVTVAGFKGAILCRPPRKMDKPQLYIEGGDQSVNLADFGIKHQHEVEILGLVIDIVYHTEKTHLRPEDGGKGNYGHAFKTTRDGDRHVKIRDGRYPTAVYDVRNKRIQLAGGTYDIPAEGING